jgi:hypothetical protein
MSNSEENFGLYDDGSEIPAPRPRRSVPTNPAPQALGGKISASKFRNATSAKTKDEGSSNTSRAVQTTIPVQSPNKLWFVRVHPDPEMSISGLKIIKIEGASDETYFLAPDVDFPDELDQYIVPANLTLAVTAEGRLFFWLCKLSAKSPKESVRRCQAVAKTKWIRIRWDAQVKGYSYTPARSLQRDPDWGDESLDELLEKALGDHYIDTPDHAVIQKLINPQDEDFTDE